jgi:hypothetical protein
MKEWPDSGQLSLKRLRRHEIGSRRASDIHSFRVSVCDQQARALAIPQEAQPHLSPFDWLNPQHLRGPSVDGNSIVSDNWLPSRNMMRSLDARSLGAPPVYRSLLAGRLVAVAWTMYSGSEPNLYLFLPRFPAKDAVATTIPLSNNSWRRQSDRVDYLHISYLQPCRLRSNALFASSPSSPSLSPLRYSFPRLLSPPQSIRGAGTMVGVSLLSIL